MNDENVNPQEAPVGFWTRLALALEPLGESYEERLEKRIQRLEKEVSRLSRVRNEA